MTSLFPGGAVGPDLSCLLHVKSLAGLVILERRTLQVHAEPGGPDRRRVRGGAPPDAFAQALRIRLEAQQAGRVGKHGSRIWLGKAFTAQQIEEDFRMASAHVGVALAFRGLVAE